ncbi:DUF4199 domain-containing protein [Hanstruepera marina]|uniref:DUF4199 domain-containing protein n=1 Tax=Hanstruepera marina TaxID=2873265 RepID=UPI001CA742F3|nr:DUF4199 domain-containing protein [Hanstruepera marina]
MRNTVLKYGSYGFLAGIIFFGLAFLLGDNLSYSVQEIIGYTSMVVSLSFIFFGIKHYRDKVNQGTVTFGKALVIGLLISIFVGIGVAIIDYIYTTVINPDFATEYLDKTLATMKETMSAEEYDVEKVKLSEQMEAYGGSGFMAFIMFATVVMIGFVISLISGLILQRKN